MALLDTLPRIEEHRISVVFNCPSCRGESVRGTAYKLRETIRFTERVPAWGWQSHWVRCSKCRAELHADCASEKLENSSALTVSGHLRKYESFPRRFIAWASLALAWAPAVGVVIAIVATMTNARFTGWPRVVSIASLILAVAANATLIAVIVHYAGSSALPGLMP
ncbi:MAG TPA: hypothetical protein VF624_17155 [Tepidisphaeraceae bacterium]|jgi:hypothetical protein